MSNTNEQFVFIARCRCCGGVIGFSMDGRGHEDSDPVNWIRGGLEVSYVQFFAGITSFTLTGCFRKQAIAKATESKS